MTIRNQKAQGRITIRDIKYEGNEYTRFKKLRKPSHSEASIGEKWRIENKEGFYKYENILLTNYGYPKLNKGCRHNLVKRVVWQVDNPKHE